MIRISVSFPGLGGMIQFLFVSFVRRFLKMFQTTKRVVS